MKNFLKKIYFGLSINLLQDARVVAKLRSQITQKGLRSVNDLDYSKYKTSDTLFILGSGSSLNKISKDEWSFISKHDSFGFNYFFFHEHVPTYYAMETTRRKETFEAGIEYLNTKADKYKGVPFIINYQHLKASTNTYKNSKLAENDIYYNVPAKLNTLKKSRITTTMKRWLMRRSKKLQDTIHHSATLSYIIQMGIIMGYKKIVILGVDLNSTKYFYEDLTDNPIIEKFNNERIRHLSEKYGKLGKNHVSADKSLSSEIRCLPIHEYLELFNNLLSSSQTKIYNGNPSSLLASFLPFYNLEEESTKLNM